MKRKEKINKKNICFKCKKNCLLRGSQGRAQRKGAPVPFMYTLSMRSLISQQNIQKIIWFSKIWTHTTNIKNEIRRLIHPTNVLFNGILSNKHNMFTVTYSPLQKKKIGGRRPPYIPKLFPSLRPPIICQLCR